ncbi:murein hydrolase activator EnvC family protein, partial [Brachybacterium hainanense]
MRRSLPRLRPVPASGHATVLMVATMLLALLLLPAAPAGGEPGAPRWLWPVGEPHPVVRAFEPPASRWGPGHRGIDVLAPGPEVRAVEDGTVRFAGMLAGRPVLSIQHADGLISTYEPVTAQVAVGEAVRAGQVVGALEAQGGHCADGACLHLGARRGQDRYEDPLLLLGARGPSVLLPLAGRSGAATGARASTPGPAAA